MQGKMKEFLIENVLLTNSVLHKACRLCTTTRRDVEDAPTATTTSARLTCTGKIAIIQHIWNLPSIVNACKCTERLAYTANAHDER